MDFTNVFGFLKFGTLHSLLDQLRTEKGFSSLFIFSFNYSINNLFLTIKGRQEK